MRCSSVFLVVDVFFEHPQAIRPPPTSGAPRSRVPGDAAGRAGPRPEGWRRQMQERQMRADAQRRWRPAAMSSGNLGAHSVSEHCATFYHTRVIGSQPAKRQLSDARQRRGARQARWTCRLPGALMRLLTRSSTTVRSARVRRRPIGWAGPPRSSRMRRMILPNGSSAGWRPLQQVRGGDRLISLRTHCTSSPRNCSFGSWSMRR